MSFLTGGGKKAQATQAPAVSGLQLQSSAFGKAIALVYGATRLAPNLIWYGDFAQLSGSGSSSQGGKGGGGGGKSGGGKGGGGSGQTNFQTAVALALCEGPIAGFGQAWADKAVTSPAALGLTTFIGSYPQAPWGYLATNHPDQALGYNGIAYLAASAYQLGGSAQLPNHTVEVLGALYATAPGVSDADPSRVVSDLLTNPHYGAGFPAARLGSLATYQSYTLAAGLWISPAYAEQRQASDILEEIARSTNSAFVWSSGVLTLVPYGDEPITANGYTYMPPAAPLYDLTDDDFLGSGSGANQDPVLLARQRPADALNDIKLEFLNRQNQYNPEIVEAKDQAMIDVFGLRADPSRPAHLFADAQAARHSAQLQLQREAIRNTYQFTLDERYILLDPMDIVTLTDAALGLDRQWVRITEIAENDDGTLSVTAEEYLAGTGAAAIYAFAQGQGFGANYNDPAPGINPPIFFEPTDELAGDLELWIALSGPGSSWGGCDIWISGDGSSYQFLDRFAGPTRMGTLAAALPGIDAATTGPTIDAANALAVDISESGGQLIAGTQQDALAGNTLCYVDGEYIAYETATLTGAGQYALGYLNRGLFGSPIAAHAAGANFARLDGHLFTMPFTQDRIGATVYFKFLSFNPYQGGAQTLAEAQPYAYTFQGSALASPLPEVKNLVALYTAGFQQLAWDEVADFRAVMYEVRSGPSPSGASVLGRVAHPPFTVPGVGTYWLAAVSQPKPGLIVYSEQWASLVVTTPTIGQNEIASWDEAATRFSGMLSGAAALAGTGSGETITVVLDYTDSILAVADWLNTPDVLHLGAAGASGGYQIPTAHEVDGQFVRPLYIVCGSSSIGQVPGESLFGIADWLGTTDILGNAASDHIGAQIQIQLADRSHVWGAWQNYKPGVYSGRYARAQVLLTSGDSQTQAILEDLTFAVFAGDRVDDYVGVTIPPGGLPLAYSPNGAGGTAAPFIAGPGGAGLPQLQVTLLDGQAGDVIGFSGQTLAGATIAVTNGGAGVARSANILARGF